MSCLGENYNPTPPNVWSRATTPQIDMSYNDFLMYRKISSLRHPQNAECLTKKQQYAKIASSSWVNRKTVWANIPAVCPVQTKCLPVSFSGVPGKGYLCSTQIKPTLLYRRNTTSSGNTSFPFGYKFV
jgi:hypothetical protein